MRPLPITRTTKAIDTYEPLSAVQYRSCIAKLGIGAVFRYIENLTLGEVEAIDRLGLILIPITTNQDWRSSLQQERLDQLGLGPGGSLCLDCEGTTPAVGLVNAWSEDIIVHRHPGIYIGEGTTYDSRTLSLLASRWYFKGASRLRDDSQQAIEPTRGWIATQTKPLEVTVEPGLVVDVDFIEGCDYLGDHLIGYVSTNTLSA